MPSEFEESVYGLCSMIPEGMVSTYAEIARALGTRAYRAVGSALGKNPYAPIVPCHRVVSSDGSLGGFSGGGEKKTLLLKKEGVIVEDGRIKRFDQIVYRFTSSS